MKRANLFFILSSLASLSIFRLKSEHSLDLILLIPVGLFFLFTVLLVFQPVVTTIRKLQFLGAGLLVWLVLFAISYNLLFFVLAPLAGGVGAWLILLLSGRLLDVAIPSIWPVITVGFLTAVAGVLFMMISKNLPFEISVGVKAGIIVFLWQIGVGLQMVKYAVTEKLV